VTYSIEIAAPDDFADVIRIDDDATELYATAGIALGLTPVHPFTVAEQARWRRSVELGRLFFARDEQGQRVGLAALDRFDGVVYLDQLSVRRSAMRRGAGRFLLRHAVDWARSLEAPSLWLTTYGHLSWNRPFYESEGFVVVPEVECTPEILHHLDEQRAALPAPEERVAMRCMLKPR
jgi:GNAT superfamily N-acetyltransferase